MRRDTSRHRALLATVGFAALFAAAGCATPEGYEAAAAESRRNALDSGHRLYEEAMERHFRLPLERAARICSVGHPDARGVRILSRLDAAGAVQEVILHPDSTFGHCVHEKIEAVEFAAPPEPDYWISLEAPPVGSGR